MGEASILGMYSSLGRNVKDVAATMRTAADDNVDDDLTKLQFDLRDLKNRISFQSKKNFLLQRDVKYLDGRIGLLIHNRMTLDDAKNPGKQQEKSKFPDAEEGSTFDDNDTKVDASAAFDEMKKELYGNLFFLLQTEPKIIADLTRLCTVAEIDFLMQTVMFTLYGNQYDTREEYLLLSVFQNVLAFEFESTVEFSNLLRANTPITRMMTTYTRRSPGEAYLKNALSGVLSNIVQSFNENGEDLEINPVKVYASLVEAANLRNPSLLDVNGGKMASVVTPEEANVSPQVKEVIAPRVDKITELTGKVLESIYNSLDLVPYGIRWICKQIRSLTKRKYPEATDLQICSMIGGFFFLRYVNPAIVAPHANAIIMSNPPKAVQRTFTLIAKVLQNLANKPSYAKEEYMIVLNSFVEAQKQSMNDFLMSLCDVPDFYEALEMEQYLALVKKDSMELHISANEVATMHQLLLKYSKSSAANRIDDNRLDSILEELGSAPAKVPKQDDRSYVLALISKWGNEIVSAQEVATSNALTENEELYIDSKALLIQIVRLMPAVFEKIVATQAGIQQKKNFTVKAVPLAASSKENRLTAALSYLSSHVISNDLSARYLQFEYPGSHFDSFLNRGTISRIDQSRTDMRTEENYTVPASEVMKIRDLANTAAKSKDSGMRRRGAELSEKLQKLETIISRSGGDVNKGFDLMADEARRELIHIGNFRAKITQELNSLSVVYESITEQNEFLRSRLIAYNAYLNNVREQSSAVTANKGKGKSTIPVNVTHQQLEKDLVIRESNVPDTRRPNVFFVFISPVSGSFLASMYYKGRDNPILEMDLKLDDLLEKQQQGIKILDMEFVQFDIDRLLALLKKHFM